MCRKVRGHAEKEKLIKGGRERRAGRDHAVRKKGKKREQYEYSIRKTRIFVIKLLNRKARVYFHVVN